MHYDSAVPSPFLDKKLQPNTPQLKPRALSPSNSEEHQYDIPFSHLKRTQELHSTTHHRSHDFEDMETSRHHVKQRTSRTSNRTSSGTSTSRGMYELWAKWKNLRNWRIFLDVLLFWMKSFMCELLSKDTKKSFKDTWCGVFLYFLDERISKIWKKLYTPGWNVWGKCLFYEVNDPLLQVCYKP